MLALPPFFQFPAIRAMIPPISTNTSSPSELKEDAYTGREAVLPSLDFSSGLFKAALCVYVSDRTLEKRRTTIRRNVTLERL